MRKNTLYICRRSLCNFVQAPKLAFLAKVPIFMYPIMVLRVPEQRFSFASETISFIHTDKAERLELIVVCYFSYKRSIPPKRCSSETMIPVKSCHTQTLSASPVAFYVTICPIRDCTRSLQHSFRSYHMMAGPTSSGLGNLTASISAPLSSHSPTISSSNYFSSLS